MTAVPETLAPRLLQDWQEQLRHAIRSPEELARAVAVPLSSLGYEVAADRDFPLLVPRAFAARIRRGDPADPLLRHLLATGQELDPVAGAAHFAVDEGRARRIVGELAALRPGYLVPRLAVEIPGAASKRELAPDYDDRSGD